MAERYFSLEEANQLLPYVEKELVHLQKLQREFHNKHSTLQSLKYTNHLNAETQFQLECEIEFLEIEARTHVRNIESQGVLLKDIELGLLDFPTRINGEEVVWCWKQGEPDISHYHGLHEGFAGRKKID